MTAPYAQGVTPVYGLRYILEGQPARDTRKYLEENAHTIEAALVAGGITPPGAADLAALVGRVNTLEAEQDAPWVDYVQRFTGGSGFVEGATTNNKGRYHRVGTMVTGTFYIATGAGFVPGSGPFAFTLPVPARVPAAGSPICGTSWMWRSGNSALGALRQVTTTSAEIVMGNGASPQVGAAVPWAWGTGMELTGQFTYEAA
jgi:hypothetical protein